MFKIFTELKPFFDDNYRRISVREYAKIIGSSPATASKVLENYHDEGILKKERDRIYIYYFVQRDSILFRDLSRLYWRFTLEKIGLLEYLKKEFALPVVILFGSCAKGEVGPHSDIDIAIFSAAKKELQLDIFEKKLKREIQIFHFASREAVSNKELLNNILSGYILLGSW